MDKRTIAVVSLALALFMPACSKSKEEPVSQDEFAIESFAEGKQKPATPAPLPKDQKLDIPAYVKAKYKKVEMAVIDYNTKEVTKFEVKIGQSAKVPGTDYEITVHSYIPHWMLKGKTVTTKDEHPDDPAVRATITEGGKTVFDGYIFQKHQTPSFRTEKNAIGLSGAS